MLPLVVAEEVSSSMAATDRAVVLDRDCGASTLVPKRLAVVTRVTAVLADLRDVGCEAQLPE